MARLTQADVDSLMDLTAIQVRLSLAMADQPFNRKRPTRADAKRQTPGEASRDEASPPEPARP